MENNTRKFGGALIQKFVNEEIMTKAELDNVLSKYVAHTDNRIDRLQNDMDKRFDRLQTDMDKRFERVDARYNWILGTVLSVGAALAGLIFACANFLSKFH
ncbi:MAG: hypothetical protein K0R14_2092 [Burkholderiales bacterium]|jgi:flagellar capping protein FliD|nr:hypothetical protein [Burkholderiales bacterium]